MITNEQTNQMDFRFMNNDNLSSKYETMSAINKLIE